MFVPVVDHNQQSLMPTTPPRARRWIKSGQATPFWKGGIFCIRLNGEPSMREVQPIAVGIDPGSKKEGYSVRSEAHTYLNIQADARAGVKDSVKQRRRMRRTRRQRTTPCRFPVSVFVVEDLKAQTLQGKKRWNSSFSPLQVGKQWFYEEIGKLAPVQTRQGYETQALREQLGLKKTGKKLAEIWAAHCVDAWVLAYSAVGGRTSPDNQRLVCIEPFTWHHRQLHRFQPEKGGKRKPYGGTLSQGIKRGTLVKHPKWGKATVGGTTGGKLSLHDQNTNRRLTQTARVADCILIKVLRWRVRLVPSAVNEGTPASSPS